MSVIVGGGSSCRSVGMGSRGILWGRGGFTTYCRAVAMIAFIKTAAVCAQAAISTELYWG